MERLTWAQKYSKRTIDIYVRGTKIGMVGYGCLILALLAGFAMKPRFTEAYVWAWVVIGAIMAGALACLVAMCVLLVRFFRSARIDRRRRRAGLPVNPGTEE